MPIDGDCAWKERGITPDERVNRLFNLIEHAVENGVPLQDLYNRKHLCDFVRYLLLNYEAPCKNCEQPFNGDTHA